MEDQQWYIKTKSGQRGPYSKQQLQRYIDAGALRPNAGIGDGQGQWVAASTVAGLNFPASPSDAASPDAASQPNDGPAPDAAQRDAALEARAAELSERERILQQQQDEARRKADELKQLAAELEQRRETLQRETRQQAERLKAEQSRIGERDRQLAEQAAALQRREQQLDDREQKLVQTQQSRAELEQTLASSQQKLAATEERLVETAQKLTETEQELARSQQELQQREAELQTREAELDQQRDALRRAEQAVEIHPSNEPATATDEVSGVHDLLAEKRKLLEEFARRQESLSQREADLIRRENELTRRELNITKLPPAIAANPSERDPETEIEPAAADTDTEPASEAAAERDATQPPAEPPQTEPADESDAPPLSWGEFLNSRAAARAAEQPPAADQPPAANEPEGSPAASEAKPAATDFAAGESHADLPTDLAETFAFRNQVYEERFGPRTDGSVDDDPRMRVDVSIHGPHGGREFTTLVTNGMSDYPIAMPNGQRSVRAELVLYATHVDETALQLLRAAAKLPYQRKQGLSIGTTGSLSGLVPAISGSKLKDCVYLLPVVESDSKPIGAKEQLGGSIQLFWLVAITEAERKLIENGGIHRFLSLLEKNSHAVYFDLTRDCYVKRKAWFRRSL
jgi:septal ring factor EnvC (AmiA/AmiB activator)